MEKNEIEKAAILNALDKKDSFTSKNSFIAGANFVNEKQPYSAYDMISFGNYCINSRKPLFGDELLKLWEESK